MNDRAKTKGQLIDQLAELRHRITELEASEAERKWAEEALRKAEQEKTAILESMSELVTYQDTKMRVLWANRRAGQSVGLAPEQLVGRHCYEIWHQRRPCVDCPVARALQTAEAQEGEMTTPDGRVWLIRGNPVRDANGCIVGAVELTQDITERKQTEQVLRESKELLEKTFLS